MNKKVIFLIILFFLGNFMMYGDTRSSSIDVYLVLDKSLSMVEEIESVKEYVEEKIVKEILMPGDNFTLILFYGKAVVVNKGTVISGDDKNNILEIVESIKADGHFTDIGNALDKLAETLDSGTGGKRKYLLLITDGKQEAPPESKYYAPDHSFNHEFLKNTKIIQKKGWKIEILGIGVESAAKELAEKLSGSYSEVPENASSEDIEKSIGDFLGMVTAEAPPRIGKPKKDGSADLEITLSSKDYKSGVTVTIDKILLTSPYNKGLNILKNSVSVNLDPDSEKKIPLSVSVPLREKAYNAEISFIFSEGESFSPAVYQIAIPSVVNNSLLVYSIIAGVVILLIIVFILRTRKPADYDEEKNKKDR